MLILEILIMNKKKSKMQKEILNLALENNRSAAYLCTGAGKTKIGIDYCTTTLLDEDDKFLWIVPTVKLRDKTIYEEFVKWKEEDFYHKYIERSCYVSINKIKGNHYRTVILDEGDKLTEANVEFFENNTVDNILLLTALKPRDEIKRNLILKLGIKEIYSLSLDEGVKQGIVSPYRLFIVQSWLNRDDNSVLAGSKIKPFYTTEFKNYRYLDKMVRKNYINMVSSNPADYNRLKKIYQNALLKRMHFLYSLTSKTEIAKRLIELVHKPDERTLCFSQSIEQADAISKYVYHSKSGEKYYNAFCNENINLLSTVNMLNRGDNISNLDNAIIVQCNSNPVDLIQRIGRIVRYREDHLASIYIICSMGTQDEIWVKKAIANLDQENITYAKIND